MRLSGICRYCSACLIYVRAREYSINMSSIAVTQKADIMGKVITKFKVWNIVDEVKAKEGMIAQEAIRSYEGEGLVDTGATILVMPEDVVEKLGLMIDRETTVVYANGEREKRKIAGGLKIEIQGRRAEVECIVENKGTQVLIGQVPLEVMDLMVDPAKGILHPRPGYEDSPLIELY